MPNGPEQMTRSLRIESENEGSFAMEIYSRPDGCRIEMSGMVTLAPARALDQTLAAICATRPMRVEIDTVGVVSMSCLATATLLEFCRALRRWQG